MNISIYILCHNESALISHTIAHYKKYIPSCNITIYDNESTDNSVEIAKSLGCEVVSWSSNNIINDYTYSQIKNTCWKSVINGWIIMIDMDEWLCVTEEELQMELESGTSVLRVEGINMIGESEKEDLSDINPHAIQKYKDFHPESKNLCFLKDKIQDMNYELGAHTCNPIGTVQYSSKQYYNKHMDLLGIPFYLNKMKKRFDRSHEMRSHGLAYHYIDNTNELIQRYVHALESSKILEHL
jgi:glycosyltransferase involved in cell wall biosynthesis